MKHLLRRVSGFFCALVLAAVLSSCGGGANSFTWFVEQIPANLDPQVALEPSDVIACTNLYSGLVRRTPEGELAPALAESWEVSADGLRYTFTLRPELRYTAAKGAQTDYAITAQDFVFAFQRVFQAETHSPYAVDFAAIHNSGPVLAGERAPAELGVQAADDRTLVFRLSERDDNFLAKLALPGAMPCDEAFFTQTRGTYGLKTSSTLSSGSFYIYNWTSGGLFLRRSPSGSQVDSLRLVQNTNNMDQSAEELILNERCSAAPDESSAPTALRSIPYSDTTWGLIFQCGEDSVFAAPLLRQALIASVQEAELDFSSPLYPAAQGLIPEGLTVDGLDYRAQAGDPRPHFGSARELYMEARQGMSNSAFDKVTLLIPQAAVWRKWPHRSTASGKSSCPSTFLWSRCPLTYLKSGCSRGITALPLFLYRPKAAAYTRCCCNSPPKAAARPDTPTRILPQIGRQHTIHRPGPLPFAGPMRTPPAGGWRLCSPVRPAKASAAGRWGGGTGI